MRRENTWLIASESTGSSDDFLESFELKFDSQVYTFEAFNESVISVSEIYRIADSWPIKVNPVGLWSPETGLVWTKSIIWERRRNLEGHSFLCATEAVLKQTPIIFL